MPEEKTLKQRAQDLLAETVQRPHGNPDNPRLSARRDEIKNILCFVNEPDDQSRRSAWKRIRQLEKDPLPACNHEQHIPKYHRKKDAQVK